MPHPLKLEPLASVRGTVRVPGDKSISHRALMFAAVATGESRICGLASGQDVRSTAGALRRLGVPIRRADDQVVVEGVGWEGLDRGGPDPLELDCGNSGTTARLLMGLLAGRRGRFVLMGDRSLSRRPMGRITRPLTELGARSGGGETLPIEVAGTSLRGAPIATGVASAQVKSAVILAALQAHGESRVVEPRPTRDHTERLLAAMGAPVRPAGDGPGWHVRGGAAPLSPLSLTVPGDPSAAVYPLVLACCLPASRVTVEEVGLNPRRTGLLRLLQRMGAELDYREDAAAPEPSGCITARSSRLHGIDVGAADVVDAIDELPLLAVAAATARGRTTITGAGELRHKESDRIAATVALLRAFGARVTEREDGMVIDGGPLRGARVDAAADHRIAMSAAVAAAMARGPSTLAGHEWVRISHPDFFEDLRALSSGAS